MDIVILGCLCIDNSVNAEGVSMVHQFGGNCAYGAAGANMWNSGKVGMVARMGDDFPREWIRMLFERGIDTEGIREVHKRHLMFAGMFYDENGDRWELSLEKKKGEDNAIIADFPAMTPEMIREAQEDFAPTAEDIPDSYADAKCVMIASRHYDRQLAYARYFRDRNPGCRIVMDLGQDYLNPGRKDDMRKLFSLVDIVMPSEDEVKQIFGADLEDMCLAAKLLCSEYGANNSCVKIGKDGCIIYEKDKDRLTHVDIFKVKANDPTGAGDSFCGGFAVGLMETGDLVEAARYGAVSSSFIVEHFGAAEALKVPREQAEARLQEVTYEVL